MCFEKEQELIDEITKLRETLKQKEELLYKIRQQKVILTKKVASIYQIFLYSFYFRTKSPYISINYRLQKYQGTVDK